MRFQPPSDIIRLTSVCALQGNKRSSNRQLDLKYAFSFDPSDFVVGSAVCDPSQTHILEWR